MYHGNPFIWWRLVPKVDRNLPGTELLYINFVATTLEEIVVPDNFRVGDWCLFKAPRFHYLADLGLQPYHMGWTQPAATITNAPENRKEMVKFLLEHDKEKLTAAAQAIIIAYPDDF